MRRTRGTLGSSGVADTSREADLIYKSKRYLGNVNTLEVHDTRNENTNCQLDEIASDHRRWYDTLTEAKSAYSYDNCYWCLGNSSR